MIFQMKTKTDLLAMYALMFSDLGVVYTRKS